MTFSGCKDVCSFQLLVFILSLFLFNMKRKRGKINLARSTTKKNKPKLKKVYYMIGNAPSKKKKS